MGGRGGSGASPAQKSAAAKVKAARVKSTVRSYVNGKSLRQIATDQGRSASSVHSDLTRSGVQLRARGGYRRRSGG